MKKILNNEEFSAAGRIWVFDDTSGKVVLKNLRLAGRSKPSFIPPTIEECKAFFKEKGYVESAAVKFHDYYSLGDWKDGKGNAVKNWKQKASSVWFRDEHKIKEQPKGQAKDKFMF